jgi:hypothetical protein
MSEHTLCRRRLAIAFAGAALLLAVTACASRGKPTSGSPFTQGQAERNEIQIHVVNLNFNDATVWALVRDVRRDRLGMVTGKSEATFTMPWTFSDEMRLEFDLIGGVRCFTEAISVDPGDVLEMQISVDPSQDPMCS